MTTTSLRATSTDLRTLIDLAHDSGLRVWWRSLPDLDAAWSAHYQSIWIRPDLTDAETRALLAHELGHAYYGDVGPQLYTGELRAWRYAANLLISDEAYAAAERLHGPHLGGLADALGTTHEVVLAYQSMLDR